MPAEIIEYRRVYSKGCGCELWVSEAREVEGKSLAYAKSMECSKHEFVTVLQNKGEDEIR